MNRWQISIALCCLFFTVKYTVFGQEGASNPEEAKIITSDISNFWTMYDHLPEAESKEDTIQMLHNLYISKASSALQEYFEAEQRENKKNIEEEYLAVLRQYPKFLASIRNNTESIEKNKDSIYKYFIQAKALYPDFEFHDTYFCIGFFNSAGRSMPKGGLYIGTEMFALSDEAVLDEWDNSPWLRFFQPISHIHNIVLHEQTHFQQLPPADNDYNLLYNAINEGAAVFLVDIVTDGKGVTNGGAVSEAALNYGDANEQEVWRRFKANMYAYDQSDWFYNADSEAWPKDMGYYVGYKICRSYYDHAKDKPLAIKEILEVTNPTTFLDKSKYTTKFE
jgi:hypothetical protein